MCFLIAGNSTQCRFFNESIADLIDNSTFPLGRHIETGMYKFCIDSHGPHRSPEEDYSGFQYHFTNKLLSPLVEEHGSLFEINLNLLYPKMLYVKFG